MISRTHDRKNRGLAKKCLNVLIALLSLTGLAACETRQPPLHFPSLPVRDILQIAEKRSFKTMKHDSFRKAYLRYPSRHGSKHMIPIGGYLASRIAALFPRDVEVDELELIGFQADCDEKEGSLFSSERVICTLSGQLRLLLYKASHHIEFSVHQADIGKRVRIDQPVFSIGTSPDSDVLTRQLSYLMDYLTEDMTPKLNELFIRVERSTLF